MGISTVPDMPRYTCRLVLRAAQIKAIVGCIIYFEDMRYDPIQVASNLLLQHYPKKGDYYVVLGDDYPILVREEVFKKNFSMREETDSHTKKQERSHHVVKY